VRRCLNHLAPLKYSLREATAADGDAGDDGSGGGVGGDHSSGGDAHGRVRGYVGQRVRLLLCPIDHAHALRSRELNIH
jgi:hypothetical protein